jgi:cytosine/adenosine deaminase-related metal-dependent hydrolase
VCPGFIDTHVHSGHRAAHRLISDAGRPDAFGQPFLEVSAPRAGTRIEGDIRYMQPGDAGFEDELELHATYTAAELLRNGITTFVEFGARPRVQEALAQACTRLGLRAYLGPGYCDGHWTGDADGRLALSMDTAAGRRGMDDALRFVERLGAARDGLLRGILVPRELDAMSLELLRRTRDAADQLGLPVAIHAAYSLLEFHHVVREHRMTPIELLDSVGLLRPTLNIGHGNLIGENPVLNYSGAHDLRLMGAAGVSISHCPVNLVRRGRSLDSWQKYREAGVNIALGTDTYPRDMILNMRAAAEHGKVMSRSFLAATAAEVFSAATLAGARALGRDDLGRLAPGAPPAPRADILIIDLTGRGGLRFGPVRDPVKALVECGIGDDVETTIVAGRPRMQGGKIPGVDLETLRARAQASAERIWAGWQRSDALGRSAEALSPWSFCPSCARDER